MSPTAERSYRDFLRAIGGSVVGLDFDGTLAPIVEDPDQARIHPEAAEVLLALGSAVPTIAVITGRPARQVLALGELAALGRGLAERGCELHVLGQYGNEQWSSTSGRVQSPRPPQGLATFLRELPGVLRAADAAAAYVEEKGLAVAVHTRRLADPQAAFERLLDPLGQLAASSGLVLEPGRRVIEVRAPGMDKGVAVRRLAQARNARGFLFAGDDLGDVEAFAAVADLREEGLATLLVCSASEEQSALADRADLVVPGPDGVLDLLRRLTRDAAAVHA